jgi:hypothetical protein
MLVIRHEERAVERARPPGSSLGAGCRTCCLAVDISTGVDVTPAARVVLPARVVRTLGLLRAVELASRGGQLHAANALPTAVDEDRR